MSLLFSDATISGCTFKDNSADIETAGIFMTFSTVTVSGCTFENSATFYNSITPSASTSTSVPGGFIYVSVGVKLALTT